MGATEIRLTTHSGSGHYHSERENDLVIATFGRGFYILDDYSPLRTFKRIYLKRMDISSLLKMP